MSITYTPSMTACEQTRATVLGVLKQQDTTVLAARCARSNLLVTPYAHDSKGSDYRYYYQVPLSGKDAYTLQYHGEDSRCGELKTTNSNWCLVTSQPRKSNNIYPPPPQCAAGYY